MLYRTLCRHLSQQTLYKQGQQSLKDPKIREYFYYVQHTGLLFLDDSRMKNFTSSYKSPEFLTFFFRNLKANEYAEYADTFPYVSLCGVERNYVRCDDLPIVFTKLVADTLHYGYYTDKLHVKFTPQRLEFANGRLYHPTFLQPPKITKGLIRSQLAMELSSKFIYNENNEAKGIVWDGQEILFTEE